MSETWTDDRVAQLTRLWEAGILTRKIAEELGSDVTPKAVIGKANRLGLPSRKVVYATEEERRAAKARHDKARHAKKRSPSSRTLRELFVPQPIDDLRRFSKDILFQDLEPHHCRYAYCDEQPYLFCGNDVQDKSSYCPGHHLICWKPAPVSGVARKYFGTDFARAK